RCAVRRAARPTRLAASRREGLLSSSPRIEPTATAWYSAPVQALAWARGSMTLLYDWLKKAAKAQGNNKAVVYRDNYLSWRGLLHRVDRRAQEFQSMGIKKGAWVGLMLGNVPDFVILALALSRLDATIVPIDPTTGGRELELILAAAPLRALVTRPRG